MSIAKVWYNPEYESYEAVYSDGYIQPLRDSVEAEDCAHAHGLEVQD